MPELFWTVYRIVFAGLMGLLIGSFLNVCIYRLPRGETIVRGHSYCPYCRHKLHGTDLMPVVSYLLLRRRCRYCQKAISGRYVKVEAITGTGFALLVWLWGTGPLSPARQDRAAYLSGVPDSIINAAVICCLLTVFSALLVWAMILFDRKTPPRGLYLFMLLPLIIKLVWQPQRGLMQLLAAGLAALVCWLGLILPKLPKKQQQQRWHLLAGFAVLGFAAGLPAFLPVPVICLILWIATRQKQTVQPEFYYVVTPSVAVLTAFLAMLIM